MASVLLINYYNPLPVFSPNTSSSSENIGDYHGVEELTHGRNVSYDIPDPDLPEVSQWLIANPNRINLGRIGLTYKNATITASQITDPRQELTLWDGTITSTFKVDGKAVQVITQGDFETDAVAFDIKSDLISLGDLKVELDFPYPPIHSTAYKFEVFVGVYDFPQNHTTFIADPPNRKISTAHIYHEMQDTKYFTNLRWPSTSSCDLQLIRNEPAGSTAVTAHRYTLAPRPSSTATSSSTMTFTAHFSPEKRIPDLPSAIQQRNRKGWNEYWSDGGFVDLTASTNPNATELQRRILLSQYHVRVNSAAHGQSPQESGLMNNGWYGELLNHTPLW